MKQIYLLFLLIVLGLKAFCQGYTPSYTKVKEERYGDGQYWEYDAYNYQNYPYTLFDHTSNITISAQKDSIISLIKKDEAKDPDGDFYTTYKELWNFAWTPVPDNVKPDAGAPSQRAAWAKARAFIYYLNIDPNGNKFDSMYNAEGFAWEAERALQLLAYDVPSNPNKLLIRSRELLAAVQAYDLLKAAGRLKNDRNRKDLTVRDNLRRFARNLYSESSKAFGVLMSTTGYRRNHGLSVCAALGKAAVVFNESGAGRWNDNWKAANWARLAHWGMMECLFDATDYFKTSKKGGIYGYSEGPGYFAYAMIGTAIPFFKTYNNFVSKTHDSWVSPYGRPGKGANNVKNYMHNPDIQNLFEWYHLIQRPNGMPPSYDDTWLNSPNVIGIFDPKYNVGDELYNLDVKNVDLRVDYLVALGGLGEAGRMRKATSYDLRGITQLNGSGNMVCV